MKWLLAILPLLLAASDTLAAADPKPRPTIGPLPPAATEIGRLVRGRAQARYCGAIGFIDLGAATDGPAYYFRRRDGRVIGRCGGYCWDPDQRSRCARECPPPGWRCRR